MIKILLVDIKLIICINVCEYSYNSLEYLNIVRSDK